MRALVHASARVGPLTRIHCARWMCVRDRELEKEREILYVCVCVSLSSSQVSHLTFFWSLRGAVISLCQSVSVWGNDSGF